MANNRMWLVHVPTGKRRLIAKHMLEGWYELGPDAIRDYDKVQDLLDDTPLNNTDFAIEYEYLEPSKG